MIAGILTIEGNLSIMLTLQGGKMGAYDTEKCGLGIERVVPVALDRQVAEIKKHITCMLLQTQGQIKAASPVKLPLDLLWPLKRMLKLQAQVKRWPASEAKVYVNDRIRKFLRLYRLLQAGTTECYESFLVYCTNLMLQGRGSQNKRIDKENYRNDRLPVGVAEEIISDSGFRSAFEIAFKAAPSKDHPKVAAFLQQCKEMLVISGPGIVYANNLILTEVLEKRLFESEMTAVRLVGELTPTERKNAIDKFLTGGVQFIITTGMLDDMEVLPELEARSIISYTMPHGKISAKARRERGTARWMSQLIEIVAEKTPDGTIYCLRKEMEREAAEKVRAEMAKRAPVQESLFAS